MPQRKIRNLIIDWRYQMSHTVVLVAISALLTSGLGYFWYKEMREVSGGIEAQRLALVDAAADRYLRATLANWDRTRLLVLVGFAALFTVVMGVYGIVVTHKFAGPLFKISRHMKDIADGRLYELWGLRKGDRMKDFWAVFEQMQAKLRKRALEQIEVLDQVIFALEAAKSGGADPEHLAAQMKELRQLRELLSRSLVPASEVTRKITREALKAGKRD